MEQTKLWLTASEATALTGISVDILNRMAARGELSTVRPGPKGWRRFNRDELMHLGVRDASDGADVASDPYHRLTCACLALETALRLADDNDADHIGATKEWFIVHHGVALLRERLTL